MSKAGLVLTNDDLDVVNSRLDYLKEFFKVLFEGGGLPLRSINSLVYEAENKLSEISETLYRRKAINLTIEKLEQEGLDIGKDGE